MAWTTPRTWTAGELVTAAIMNSAVRDNFNAVISGDAPFTLVDFTGTSAPSVAAASHGRFYFDTTLKKFLKSEDGGGYATFGIPPWAEPTVISRWRDVVRY